MVSITADDGTGSLRQAIRDLNAGLCGGDRIDFGIAGMGPYTISLMTNLDAVIRPNAIIDGFSQGGGLDNPPTILIRPDPQGFATVGLHVSGGNSTIRGLNIGGFIIYGLQVDGVGQDIIHGNFLGVTPAGTDSEGNGTGLFIQDAGNNTIGMLGSGGRNLISGNNTAGILLSNSSSNLVQNNYIGTNLAGTGTVSVRNGTGLAIDGGNHNTIGGDIPALRNLISGNGAGIQIIDGDHDVVVGNYIGTDVTGAMELGNQGVGLTLQGGSLNTVGGLTAGERNIIAGNVQGGLAIQGSSSQNLVENNYIGTELGGTAALANGYGLTIFSGDNNTIGGTTAAHRNLISGNADTGLDVRGSGNLVMGNFIGTDITGLNAIPNQQTGLAISGGSGNLIGGTMAGEGNLISGNQGGPDPLHITSGIGLLITGGANANQVEGNLIGTDVGGTIALGNGIAGITITGAASNNTIGGTLPESRNLIAGNVGDGTAPGIFITGPGTNNNLVAGNLIGTDITGLLAVPNGIGVSISFGAQNNRIGELTQRGAATPEGRRNIIAGNLGAGIAIFDRNTSGNRVFRNLVGMTVMGGQEQPVALGNGEGVDIYLAATNNHIGGLIPPVGGTAMSDARDIVGNTIAGNLREGVRIYDSATTNNFVQGNLIGVYFFQNQYLPFGNDTGVALAGGSNGNLIGGTIQIQQNPLMFLRAGNTVSGNTRFGVAFFDRRTHDNVVQTNMIGTNPQGTAAIVDTNGLPVQQVGASFYGGAVNNTLGGTTADTRNVISGNAQDGVTITGLDTANNVVEGNFIGTDVTGNQLLANGLSNGANGVRIYFSAHDNTIGGTVPGAGNLISGNPLDGVLIASASVRNKVQGNFIGTDFDFTQHLPFPDFMFSRTTLGNGMNGVHVQDDGTNGNLIGGTVTPTGAGAPGNFIGFNAQNGILVDTGLRNTILGNNVSRHANGLGIALTNNGNIELPNPIVIDTATYDGATGTIVFTGHLDTSVFQPLPDSAYIVEFFGNSQGAPGEGERFLGQVVITTDDAGNFVLDDGSMTNSVTFVLPAGYDPYTLVSTTFTDPDGNTSPFSGGVPISVIGAPGVPGDGTGTTPINIGTLTPINPGGFTARGLDLTTISDLLFSSEWLGYGSAWRHGPANRHGDLFGWDWLFDQPFDRFNV